MKFLRLAHRYLVRQTMPTWATAYYDRLIDAVSDIYLQPLVNEIAQSFPGPLKILDAGTGAGHLPVLLAQKKQDFQITGVDLSAHCLEFAQAKAAQAGVACRTTFCRGNLERLDLPAASFGLIVSTCSLHHWRRPQRVFEELRRVLKPGGELWILDDAAEASAASRNQWVAEVQQRAQAGSLFSSVFWFESRFLAYSKEEVLALAACVTLNIYSFHLRDVFFLARMKL